MLHGSRQGKTAACAAHTGGLLTQSFPVFSIQRLIAPAKPIQISAYRLACLFSTDWLSFTKANPHALLLASSKLELTQVSMARSGLRSFLRCSVAQRRCKGQAGPDSELAFERLQSGPSGQCACRHRVINITNVQQLSNTCPQSLLQHNLAPDTTAASREQQQRSLRRWQPTP